MAQRATNEMIQLLFFIYASLKTILIFGSQQNEGKNKLLFGRPIITGVGPQNKYSLAMYLSSLIQDDQQ
jgi:hypothetical protein